MRGVEIGGVVGVERPDDEFRVEADDGEQREQLDPLPIFWQYDSCPRSAVRCRGVDSRGYQGRV